MVYNYFLHVAELYLFIFVRNFGIYIHEGYQYFFKINMTVNSVFFFLYLNNVFLAVLGLYCCLGFSLVAVSRDYSLVAV